MDKSRIRASEVLSDTAWCGDGQTSQTNNLGDEQMTTKPFALRARKVHTDLLNLSEERVRTLNLSLTQFPQRHLLQVNLFRRRFRLFKKWGKDNKRDNKGESARERERQIEGETTREQERERERDDEYSERQTNGKTTRDREREREMKTVGDRKRERE